jgi:hypothetical protein
VIARHWHEITECSEHGGVDYEQRGSDEERERRGEEVAVAAVVSLSGGLLRCAGYPALPQPDEGCESRSPMLMGERGNSMFRESEVSKLMLDALFKERLKATIDVRKVEVIDGTTGCELKLTGCIPSDEAIQPLSFRMSLVHEEDDLHDLIAKLGLPVQPAVPEYSEHAVIDKVGESAGFDTCDYYGAESTESASIKLVGSGSSRDLIHSYLFNDVCLTFKGFMIQGIDPEDLWTFLCTLELYSEFHALCTLYRIYELAE